jgi:hypothetical protein
MRRPAFGAAIREADDTPLEFEFGPWGEVFACMPAPSFGDVRDLHDAPEPAPANMLESAEICARFIRRMLVEDDKPRWDRTLYKIEARQCAAAIVDAAAWIAQQVSGFPTVPPASSTGGRQPTGTSSKTGSARSPRSKASGRASRSGGSTG